MITPANKYLTNRYSDFEFEDETSQFDTLGKWNGGSECFTRLYKCRVPAGLLKEADSSGDYTKIDEWITNHSDLEIWY